MNKLTTLLSKESLAKAEKYISLFIYYGLPIIVIATLVSAAVNSENVGFLWQEFRGSRGWNILAILLFIKPIIFLIKKYFKAEPITLEYFLLTLKNLPKAIKKQEKPFNNEIIKNQVFPFLINSIYSISLYLMRLRRPLGVASFRFIFTHGLLWEIFWIRQGFGLFFNIGETSIRTALLGLIALAIGAITSNNYALQKLQKNRKKVQMIAYAAFFFGAIHTGNIFWLIVYFTMKYFERKDNGTLTIRVDRLLTKRTLIKTNPRIIKQIHTIKTNKRINHKITTIRNSHRISKTIDKICKK